MAKSPKQRADQLLVARGLAETRTRAQALIMAGNVFADTRRVAKAGEQLTADADISIKGPDHPWVSRGGRKLAAALDAFAVDPTGCVGADIGASTGGFTDVLLQHGAARVYAVDVGHGQLAWSLRRDERVVVLERTNARYLTSVQIPEPLDVIVCDASFISLRVVLPPVMALAAPDARLIALVKPQFEVGRDQVGKGGVVRDPELHTMVCERVRGWLDEQPGWSVIGLTPSPVTGPEGNVEFLIAAQRAS